MALTIATGFVVDDAIVMIENISRHVEQGTARLEAAYRGSQQIGFTIISLTVSLIAVLIPLLFMGMSSAAVPRVRHHARGRNPHLGGRLAHLHAHDVRAAARAATAGEGKPGAAPRRPGFESLARHYGRSLTWVLDRQA